MGETSMKGTRLGALSLERDDRVQPAQRRVVRYTCPGGSRIERSILRRSRRDPARVDLQVWSYIHCRRDRPPNLPNRSSRPGRTGTC